MKKVQNMNAVFAEAGERVIYEEVRGLATPYYLYWGKKA